MTRATITGGSGSWFCLESSNYWAEATRWDGSNHVSLATGSQWDHETLYHTASGSWVIYWRSQWQGSTETYTVVTPERAAEWLSINDHDPPKELAGLVAALEV